MKIAWPYLDGSVTADLDGVTVLGTLEVADVPALADAPAAIRRALEQPIGQTIGLLRAIRPGETVAIIVSDSFRQTRADVFLPVLTDCLAEAGIRIADVLIVFATGTHRAPTREEESQILGPELAKRFRGRIHSHDAHDANNLRYMGTTSRGTPVHTNRLARECDRIIATGSVVMHYFGGFGGGRKAVVPGIAGVETISHNHSMNLDPASDQLNPAVRIGVLDGNPVSEDMLEATRLVGVDMILNTVLNRRQEIAGVFAGDLVQAHAAAARMARELFAVPIERRADLVIASSGGAKNFVQSHKALFNAYQAMKPGGRIVFVAPLPEGLGGEQFVKWLRLGDRASIIAELRKHSEINGQTALSSIEKSPSALFVTEMGEDAVGLLGGRKASTLQAAVDRAKAELAQSGTVEPTCYIMPSAAYVVPFVGCQDVVSGGIP